MITDEVPKDQRAYEACPQLHTGQVVWPAPEAPKPDTSASVLTPDTTLLLKNTDPGIFRIRPKLFLIVP